VFELLLSAASHTILDLHQQKLISQKREFGLMTQMIAWVLTTEEFFLNYMSSLMLEGERVKADLLTFFYK